MTTHTFGCHGSSRTAPQTCAGFLLRGAWDNLTVRLAVLDGRIDPDDAAAIAPCRSDRPLTGLDREPSGEDGG